MLCSFRRRGVFYAKTGEPSALVMSQVVRVEFIFILVLVCDFCMARSLYRIMDAFHIRGTTIFYAIFKMGWRKGSRGKACAK